MNYFGLTDYHGNYHIIESELKEDVFYETLYAFNCEYYKEFEGNYMNEEVRNKALSKLVNYIESMGYKTRLLQPRAEFTMWVWD